MPPTTGFKFGDIVLVPFPFTDQSAIKKRPAVVVSSDSYGVHRPDIVLMAITSQVGPRMAFGEARITDWKRAGLLKAGIVKPILTTVERKLVIKRLGRLQAMDEKALRQALESIIG
jgi:mRNA-degrading endonuclease toxin of MazEF toxin-antitoxin module